jgi:glycerophosphoryl diester phosphodiesterase
MAIEIIAHRGANREAPENTLPAFQTALDIGVGGIELDVQLTADGIPVVHHDAFLRDSQASPIASLSLADLRQLSDAPKLEDVLALVSARCHVYVEIKAAAAVEAVVGLLASRRDWCSVHSFDHRIAVRARALDPAIRTGILLVSYLVDVAAALRAASALDFWQHIDHIDEELVDRIHAVNGRVVAWTVNDLPRAKVLAKMGVDALCTDIPRELLAGLNEGTS